MGRLDWDRARRERLVAERGSEASWGPGPPSAGHRRPAAPAAQQKLAIDRWLGEFRGLPYEQQLSYLTTVRRGLGRLLGSDELAAQTIKHKFKPLLMSAAGGRGVVRSAGGATPNAKATAAIVELVTRRPDQLTQKQCIRLLAGDPGGARDNGR